MSNQIDEAAIVSYRDALMHVAQQRMSRLRNKVFTETFRSEEYFWDRVGKVEMSLDNSRAADTVWINTPHTRRRIYCNTYRVADGIDTRDLPRIIADVSSQYAQAQTFAAARAMDREILGGFFADAVTGKKGTSTVSFPTSTHQIAEGAAGMTTSKLLDAQMIIGNYLDDDNMAPRYVATPRKVLRTLVGENLGSSPNMSHGDWQLLRDLETGENAKWCGFTFATFADQTWADVSGLKTDSNSWVLPVWSQNSMVFGMVDAPELAYEVRADKNGARQIRMKIDIGAARDNEWGVVQMLCQA